MSNVTSPVGKMAMKGLHKIGYRSEDPNSTKGRFERVADSFFGLIWKASKGFYNIMNGKVFTPLLKKGKKIGLKLVRNVMSGVVMAKAAILATVFAMGYNIGTKISEGVQKYFPNFHIWLGDTIGKGVEILDGGFEKFLGSIKGFFSKILDRIREIPYLGKLFGGTEDDVWRGKQREIKEQVEEKKRKEKEEAKQKPPQQKTELQNKPPVSATGGGNAMAASTISNSGNTNNSVTNFYDQKDISTKLINSGL